jgi:hypothetical protein
MSMRRILELVESKPDNAVSASIFLKAKKAGSLWAGSNREIDPYGKPVERPTMRQEREAAEPPKKVILKSADDVDWEIYKPFPDNSPEEKAKYKDWRKVSSALNSAANKAVTQVNKRVTALMQDSDLDEYDDDEEIASSIAGMTTEARKKFFVPVAEKYSGYGIYDGEVERQWRNLVIGRVLAIKRFNNKGIKRRIDNWW